MDKEEIFKLYRKVKNDEADLSKLDDKTADIICRLLYEEICLVDKRIKKIKSSKK